MGIVGAFLAFIVTVVFLFAFRPVAVAIGLVDIPGGRKRHGAPVPLTGGIAMSIGLGFGSTLIDHPAFWDSTILAIYLLVTVGTIDDRFDLPANVRLIAQTCASLLIVFGADVIVSHLGRPFFFDLPLGALAAPFTILFILTVVNAFNVIDGIDGLAGALALLSFAAIAVIGAGSDLFALSTLVLAVVAAFLVFNFPLGFNRPVRTFMGDAGSTFLGLAIACIGIALCQGDSPRMSPVIGLWLIAVPVFDLFSAILRRVMDGKSPFAPDHEHLHHVLVANQVSNRSTLGVMLALATVYAILGIAGHFLLVSEGIMVIAWFCAFLLYYQLMRHPQLVVRFVIALGASGDREGRQHPETS